MLRDCFIWVFFNLNQFIFWNFKTLLQLHLFAIIEYFLFIIKKNSFYSSVFTSLWFYLMIKTIFVLDQILKDFFNFLIMQKNLFLAFKVFSFFFKCIVERSKFWDNFCTPSPCFHRLRNIAKGFWVDYPVFAETFQFFVSWKLVVFFNKYFERVVKAPDVFFGRTGEIRLTYV